MTRLTIELDDDVADALGEQARGAGTTTEAYAASVLAERGGGRANVGRFHALIREGDASGEGVELTDDYVERKVLALRAAYPQKVARP